MDGGDSLAAAASHQHTESSRERRQGAPPAFGQRSPLEDISLNAHKKVFQFPVFTFLIACLVQMERFSNVKTRQEVPQIEFLVMLKLSP
ncbi:hypothetical protein OPV22_033427 [Ensete ventricosum]|uniref:Uncharacterized protein n=1 Tax=Ensete ventricosum TaxID=4639 RepID=A0AAV8PPR8_ENSVE|nr:hypothetical protein OPV22_033427 [Ensete ventricosum]